MTYNCLLIDVDDTILDFKAAEKLAFKKTHEDKGVSFTEDDYFNYHHLNIQLWKNFEKGLITLEDIKANRYKMYFESRGLNVDSADFQSAYENNLAYCAQVFDDEVMPTLDYISKRAEIYGVTNGLSHVQSRRLQLSGVDKYFTNCFVSEKIGARKPDKRFFDYVEDHVPCFDKTKTLLVGDSLTADIPAAQYGYDTCLINRGGSPLSECAIPPKYVIEKFYELKKFFE